MGTQQKARGWNRKGTFLVILATAILVGWLLLPGLFDVLDHRKRAFELESERLENHVLKEILISKVEFSEQPFGECLQELFEQLREIDPYGPWSFSLMDSQPEGAKIRKRVIPPLDDEKIEIEWVDPRHPISLKLESVPFMEALRYTCALASAIYERDGFEFKILPLGDRGATWRQTRKVEIHPVFYRSPAVQSGNGPQDLRGEIASGLGMEFFEGDRVDYFPDENRVEAEAGEDTLELIELYLTPICYIPEPTFRRVIDDRSYEFWSFVLEKIRPSPAIPVSPSPVLSESFDPFAQP